MEMLGGLPFEYGDHQAGFFSRHLLIPKRDGDLRLRSLNLFLHPLQDADGTWNTWNPLRYHCFPLLLLCTYL